MLGSMSVGGVGCLLKIDDTVEITSELDVMQVRCAAYKSFVQPVGIYMSNNQVQLRRFLQQHEHAVAVSMPRMCHHGNSHCNIQAHDDPSSV